MPDIQHAKDILHKCSHLLKEFEKEAKEISINKDVLAWQKVNIDSFTEVIEALGLPDNLRQARDTYPAIASSVLKSIAGLQNSIANLNADIKLGPLPAIKAIPQAQKIEFETLELKPSLEKLHQCKAALESSTIVLKKNLNLTTLLPLARELATGKKKSVFETGFSIYLITTREAGFEEEGQINMYSFFDKATLLQKEITELNVQGLSTMASDMINRQIRLCHDGLQEVKDFILFVEDYIKKDTENINIFHAQLAELQRQPLTDILFNIPAETEKVGACIRDFTHKKFLLEEVDRATQLLLMIKKFYQLLKDHFLDYLLEQNSLENGLLNPDTLAQARSAHFFNGINGFWRTVRIFWGTLSGKEAISQEILKEKLNLIMTECSHYFGHQQEDYESLAAFIESHFNTYNAPFPHDELIEFAKKCLMTYGTILEKVMFRYKADKNETNSYSLGRLSGKIEVRTTNLQKYRKKLTPS